MGEGNASCLPILGLIILTNTTKDLPLPSNYRDSWGKSSVIYGQEKSFMVHESLKSTDTYERQDLSVHTQHMYF